jgi:hypothetical protein
MVVTQTRKPSKAHSVYDWEQITADLRATPEEWLLIVEQGPRSLYSAVKRQRMLALRDRDWVYEVCTRQTHGAHADLWMMARRRTEQEMDTWDSRL